MEALKEKEILKKEIKNTVFMEKIYSMEYYKKADGEIKQVLKDINFKAYKGESWVVTGESLFEIRLLLEILANTKPYQKGKCVLVETGMMRKKRVILNHTFYIGSTDMPFNNMTTLEYLVMATGKQKEKSIERQEKLLDLLVSLNLGYISLSEINKLKEEEKALIMLFLSGLSNSELIVFNIPRLKFDKNQKKALKLVCDYIIEKEKTLILSTVDMETANEVCDNVLIIRDGQVIYNGEKKGFVDSMDKVIFRIYSRDNEKMVEYFKKKKPNLKYLIKDEYIEVLSYGDEIGKDIYSLAIESDIELLRIDKNLSNVRNGYRELVKNYDI